MVGWQRTSCAHRTVAPVVVNPAASAAVGPANVEPGKAPPSPFAASIGTVSHTCCSQVELHANRSVSGEGHKLPNDALAARHIYSHVVM